ncbi:MAG TPA: histone deacetylase [Anaerolineales bacterium]
MASAYTFVPSPTHEYPDHPERPARLALLEPRLDSFGATRLEARPATSEQVGLVHHPRLVAALERVCREDAPAVIDSAPTFITKTSFEDALLAAGGVITCARAVMDGEVRNAFAIVRPPGHHAEPNRAMGFCLFNNIAIAAREALVGADRRPPLQRVLIVDYDAHHGNGTQAAFEDEPRVAFLSSHQWGIYPGTGWITDAPQAKKRILNVPLGAYAGDRTYAQMMDRVVKPFVENFRPQLMLVSAGFDAHWNDPITMLGLSTAGYFDISKKLADLAEEHCDGKIVFVLEGGYDPQNVANGAAAVFAAMAGAEAGPAVDDPSPRLEPDQESRLSEVIAWHGFA